ncbi:MAG: bifunctional riboflavin kinase/FAD synthetase [Chloroherpetonaceae bacterium]|nr:bifunctional riboflavin kinase/FAD synthetase [Chloroherpetonaceae bacterium]MDW8438412.1 bifunctional riboflavin kinase/FAD synthetase [Chloroherpetonaceae bacterium]
MRKHLFSDGVLSQLDASDATPFERKPSAVTIGSYDGVHLGHRAILSTLVSEAKAKGLRSLVITFEPHPRLVLGKDNGKSIRLLSTLDEKLVVMESLGIDCVVVIRFTKEFSETPADVFVEDFLVGRIGLAEIVVGYDHMFGKNRGGSFETLLRLAEKHGFSVRRIPEQKVDEHHLSSTAIRRALEAGEIGQANKLLGAPYQLSALVIEGEKRGRLIGFPTANLLPPSEKLIPKRGVYAVEVEVDGKRFRAMMNIGFRPTVREDDRLSLEVHLLDFDGELYGKRLAIHFLARLRDERKFANLAELKAQLERDRQAALQVASEFSLA